MKIIGEKINGTRKEVAAAIANRDGALIASLVRRQAEAGGALAGRERRHGSGARA